MRFITPIMSHAPGIAILTGAEALARRPQKPLLNALRQLGVKCYSTGGNGKPPLVIFGGGIRGGKARIKGDISSQYVTGLLFAAPCADNDVEIEVAGRLESKPYVDITLAILHKHGIRVSHDDTYGRFTIPHDQKYKPSNHLIEGDYSSAAFLLAADAVTDSRVLVRNLREDSIQGDKEIVQILREMSAKVTQTGSYVEVGGRVHAGIEVDATDIPDLVPVVAVLGCFAKGETVLKNVQRLRLKESDRVRSLTSELQKMGVRSRVRNGDLSIRRATSLQHSHFDAHDDHRIAMACSVAALGIRGSSTISNAEVVAKSYPRFFEDLKRLGGKIDGA